MQPPCIQSAQTWRVQDCAAYVVHDPESLNIHIQDPQAPCRCAQHAAASDSVHSVKNLGHQGLQQLGSSMHDCMMRLPLLIWP